MDYQYLKVTQDGSVRVLTLNRPEKLNASNVRLDMEWLDALQEAEADPTVRTIVQHGAGRAFSAGHDMEEVGEIVKRLGADARDWRNIYAEIWPNGSPWQAVAEATKPIVSAVHGHVIGQAIPLVMLTDIVVAATGTVFNLEIVRTGGAGALAYMFGLLPPKQLNELVYLGSLRAEDLLQAGAINRVVSPEQLMPEALHIARAIARIHPDSVRGYKTTLREVLARHGINDVGAFLRAGAASHGNSDDNGLWAMAADKGVDEALHWRENVFGENEFVAAAGPSPVCAAHPAENTADQQAR
jgi:enoyl-CoA hydratase